MLSDPAHASVELTNSPNMDYPVVSIVTPSYNRADVVRETAESVFSQSYPHWEWMIVDDGSTDGTRDLLKSLAREDPRVKLHVRERGPKGACTCRNIGVAESTGSHLLFLDTDDILSQECLRRRVDAAGLMPEKDFIIFPMLMFREHPGDTNLLWNTDDGRDDLERILYGDAICQGTGTLWKKESFVKTGMWDESLVVWQDVELHIRSLLMGMIHGKRMDLPPDVYIRMSQSSLSRTGFNSKDKLESRFRVLASVLQTMKAKMLLQRYRQPLRNMFTDVFFSASDSRRTSIADKMLEHDLARELFTSVERRWLRSYGFVQQYRLYRIGPLKAYTSEKIRNFVPKRKSNIGVVAYKQSGS